MTMENLPVYGHDCLDDLFHETSRDVTGEMGTRDSSP